MNELTREQKRIRIAEACGWTQCQWNGAYDTLKGVPPVRPSVFRDIPDYFGSLDAMHESESTLSDVQHNAYRGMLGSMIRTEKGLKDASILSRKFASATAEQRAEAFGRTLNLW